MSAYNQPSSQNPTFCNTIFSPSEPNTEVVNTLIANTATSTLTDSVTTDTGNIETFGTGGVITTQSTGTVNFEGFDGMTWVMSGRGNNSGTGTSGEVIVSYGENDVIGKITNTITQGYGCDAIGNGFPTEGASQWDSSTGKWTCKTKGKYLIQSNLYVNEKESDTILGPSNPSMNTILLRHRTTSPIVVTNYTISGLRNIVGTDYENQQMSNTQILHLDVDDEILQIPDIQVASGVTEYPKIKLKLEPTNSTVALSRMIITRIIG